MVAKRAPKRAQPRKKKPSHRAKVSLPSKVMNRLRRELLLRAPKDPESIDPAVSRRLRDDLIKQAPNTPEGY